MMFMKVAHILRGVLRGVWLAHNGSCAGGRSARRTFFEGGGGCFHPPKTLLRPEFKDTFVVGCDALVAGPSLSR